MALIERDREFHLLQTLFQDAQRNHGSIALVTGALATGKTELMHVFLEWVIRQGGRCVRAVASSAERTLPLGLVRQLLDEAGLAADVMARARQLLDQGSMSALAHPADALRDAPATDPPAPAHVLHGLCMILLSLADRLPLVIAVDDVHHADLASLHCLLYLVRRLRTAPVVVVLNEGIRSHPTHLQLRAELLRQPHCRPIPLQPLSSDGVEALLATRLGAEAGRHLAAEAHAVSGGNPLLILGLAADQMGSIMPGTELVLGSNYSRALIGCLYRGEAPTLKLVRGLAVLGEADNAAVLARLLGMPAETVTAAVGVLTAAGVLEHGWFRHPAARLAILDAMLPEERVEMHLLAAEALHKIGAAATTVAPHLLAADRADSPWASVALYDAAEQALAEGDVDTAINYLRLAARNAPDETQRAISLITLGEIEWRVNPTLPMRELPEVAKAVRAAHLEPPRSLAPVHWLLWFGRDDECIDLLKHALEGAPEGRPATDALRDAKAWLSVYSPTLATRIDVDRAGATPEPPLTGAVTPTVRASRLLAEVLTGGADERLVTLADQILLGSRLSGRTFMPICAALATLLYADELEAAAQWCDPLLAEAVRLHAVTWQAIFATLRAEIALCQGDLADAARHGTEAFTLLTPKDWGVVVGVPLGTLLRAYSAAGAFEEASALMRIPVPDAMYQSPIGVHYLSGRGAYCLATGRYPAAMANFQACRDLTEQWHAQLPVLASWRNEAALACLLMGREQQARELVQAQQELLTDRFVRLRGISLWVQAAAGGPDERIELLRLAVDMLGGCGDQLHLAHALADLGRAYRARGEHAEAATHLQRADRLAEQCGAEPLRRELHRETAELGQPHQVYVGRLSDAERRVAELAVRGCTNRQIARELYLTVSTIEQHLTRVYRKLGVQSRNDLVHHFQPSPPGKSRSG